MSSRLECLENAIHFSVRHQDVEGFNLNYSKDPSYKCSEGYNHDNKKGLKNSVDYSNSNENLDRIIPISLYDQNQITLYQHDIYLTDEHNPDDDSDFVSVVSSSSLINIMLAWRSFSWNEFPFEEPYSVKCVEHDFSADMAIEANRNFSCKELVSHALSMIASPFESMAAEKKSFIFEVPSRIRRSYIGCAVFLRGDQICGNNRYSETFLAKRLNMPKVIRRSRFGQSVYVNTSQIRIKLCLTPERVI